MNGVAFDLGGALRVRVVTLAELAWTPQGPARGHAHVGFSDVPVGAPGRLDFEPLVLFAAGTTFPGEGFAMHRHEHIENVLVMLSGRIEHNDALGNVCELRTGDVSVLSAGSGVEHAERVVGDETVTALVIWIRPAREGRAPAFRRASFRHARDRWTVLASGRSGARGPLPLDRDAEVRGVALARGARLGYDVIAGRRVYAIALGGELEVAGLRMRDGERLLAEGAGTLQMTAREPVEVVLVDMA